MESIGEAKSLNWEDAQNACKKFGLAGYKDWRLPIRKELETLMIKDTAGYDCPQGFLFQPEGGRMGVYWSGSPLASNHYYAWGVGFSNGPSYDNYKANYYFVRAVRSGQ